MHRTGTAPQSVTYGAPGRTPGRQPGRLVLFRSFEHRQADGQRTSWTVAVCIISITKRGEKGEKKAERFEVDPWRRVGGEQDPEPARHGGHCRPLLLLLRAQPSSYGRGDNIAMALNLQTAACGGGDGAVGLSFEYMLMRPRAFLSF
ncbi:hypothetical protein OsI_19438 [Oryza sativa Indica Group]|uniref:Uncharacterized protein n=1 Tax=Oryza sativa subsp. indica TaxID=39946 RepID=B8AWK6_ORYSI|nr:hypothetical protein OsI_19438 [Oryza sativa Indica Group]